MDIAFPFPISHRTSPRQKSRVNQPERRRTAQPLTILRSVGADLPTTMKPHAEIDDALSQLGPTE
jgi:hypothetical protein